MHRLLLEVLESHPRYGKIAPAVREAFPIKESGEKSYFNDVIKRLRRIEAKGGANSTKDALMTHFVGAARFQAYAKLLEAVPEHLRKYAPAVRRGLGTRTIQEWDRFEEKVREAAKKGNVGVYLDRIIGDINGSLRTGLPE